MKIKKLMLLLLLCNIGYCMANECMQSRHPAKTPNGNLTEYYCDVTQHHLGGAYYIKLNELKILQDSFLAREDFHPSKVIWIYTGGGNAETGCATHLFLVDVSTVPVKIIKFGVKKACNVFHWASWGDKRSVIALKNNVKFVYENGKLIPPASGEKLWKSIEPPHAGSGLAIEDAVGFVENVPLPTAP